MILMAQITLGGQQIQILMIFPGHSKNPFSKESKAWNKNSSNLKISRRYTNPVLKSIGKSGTTLSIFDTNLKRLVCEGC